MMDKTLFILSWCFLLLFGIGCSSDGNDKQNKIYYYNPQKTGYFVDAGVEGLEYSRGDGIRTLTKSGGAFSYRYGDSITFSIGNIVLGSAIAGRTLTPKELVVFEAQDFNVTTQDDRVLNRIRLLMTLDSDPAIGIQIDQDTRDAAKYWETLDFNLSEAAFTQAFASISGIDAARIVSKNDAMRHFENSLRCAYSGAYSGRWILQDGAREGFVGVLIQSNGTIVALGDGQEVNGDPNTVIYAIGTHDLNDGSYSFSNDQTYYYDTQAGAVVPISGIEIDGTGYSVGYDRVVGAFSQGSQSGRYEAFRVAQAQDTVLRYTGFGYTHSGKGIGMFSFDITQEGEIVGLIHDSQTNAEPQMHGSVDFADGNVSIFIDSDPPIVMYGVIDLERFTPDINLTWGYDTQTPFESLGYASGIGCQLQEIRRAKKP